MKSLYAKILVWSFGTLVVTLVAFFLLTFLLTVRSELPRLQAFELIEARSAWERDGAPGLEAFLARFDRAMNAPHHLLDHDSRDVLTGADYSDVTRRIGTKWDRPVGLPGGVVIGSRSADGRYTLLSAAPPVDLWRYIPYYGLILLAVVILSWPLAVNIAAPLRSLSGAVDRFGQGDLSIRVKLARRDEIGHLAGSFNRMADRIETLLVAERRLLQDVSHELRSPLARLSFAAELVRTAPDRESAVLRLKKEISRLSELVGTLLEVTRGEGDPASRANEIFSLDELVRDVVEDCRLENAERASGILLLRADHVGMTGDRELMRRAIENVLRNAIYYSALDTKVEVRLRSNAEFTSVSIRDYGPGVPPEFLQKIFQPFFRVDSSRDRTTGGLGLGLAIAFRAVGLHSGVIVAHNCDPGLLVEIRLPGKISPPDGTGFGPVV